MSDVEGEARHTDGARKNQFCSLRADTCPCGNKYKKPCASVAAEWNAKAKMSHKYAQKYGEGARRRGHEAHHIACVASVTGQITTNAAIDAIVQQTKWCVNKAENMIALPVWGHTISWYVDLSSGDIKLEGAVAAPPFADLTQHDYDHDKYLDEVDGDLKNVTKQVKKAVKEHRDPTGNLAGALDGVINKRKPQMQKAGTHAAWLQGMKDRESEWYKPFSMSVSPEPRTFPCAGGNDRMSQKIAEVRDAFLKL
ncbi:MAG: AHH domain-containing protein [Polyangiaceae bacterium]